MDWADAKARDWLQQESNAHDAVPLTAAARESLAALLREVEREVADRVHFKGAAVVGSPLGSPKPILTSE